MALTYFNGPDGFYITGGIAIGPFSEADVRVVCNHLLQGHIGPRNVRMIEDIPRMVVEESPSTTGHEGEE